MAGGVALAHSALAPVSGEPVGIAWVLYFATAIAYRFHSEGT
jgi:hypothetical protein